MIDIVYGEEAKEWYFHPFRIDDADLKKCLYCIEHERLPSNEELMHYEIDESRLDEESLDMTLLQLAALIAKEWIRLPNERDESQHRLYGIAPEQYVIERLTDEIGLTPFGFYKKFKLDKIVPILARYSFDTPPEKEFAPLNRWTAAYTAKLDENRDPIWNFDLKRLDETDLKTCLFYCENERLPTQDDQLDQFESPEDLQEIERHHQGMIEVAALIANNIVHLPHPSYWKHKVPLDVIGKLPPSFDIEHVYNDGEFFHFAHFYEVWGCSNLVPILAKYNFNQ